MQVRGTSRPHVDYSLVVSLHWTLRCGNGRSGNSSSLCRQCVIGRTAAWHLSKVLLQVAPLDGCTLDGGQEQTGSNGNLDRTSN